jgi:hypothetical protein
MIRQCAWCRRVIGQRAPFEDHSITHGLCRSCRGQVLQLHDPSISKELPEEPMEGATSPSVPVTMRTSA